MGHYSLGMIIAREDYEGADIEDYIHEALSEYKYEEHKTEPYILESYQEILSNAKEMQKRLKEMWEEYKMDKMSFKAIGSIYKKKYNGIYENNDGTIGLQLSMIKNAENDRNLTAAYILFVGMETDNIDADMNYFIKVNPKGKLDWYEIGGRFESRLLSKKGVVIKNSMAPIKDIMWLPDEAEKEKRTIYWDRHIENDSLKKRAYQSQYTNREGYINVPTTTFAVVDDEGVWHDRRNTNPESWEHEYYDKFIKNQPEDSLFVMIEYSD